MLDAITKWRRSSAAYRDVRPLLIAIALGSTIALSLTIAAAFASKSNNTIPPETKETSSSGEQAVTDLLPSGELRF